MIRDLPTEERPRERLLSEGATYLSNVELLAILLRTGTKQQSALGLAQMILQQTQGLKLLNEINMTFGYIEPCLISKIIDNLIKLSKKSSI